MIWLLQACLSGDGLKARFLSATCRLRFINSSTHQNKKRKETDTGLLISPKHHTTLPVSKTTKKIHSNCHGLQI